MCIIFQRITKFTLFYTSKNLNSIISVKSIAKRRGLTIIKHFHINHMMGILCLASIQNA